MTRTYEFAPPPLGKGEVEPPRPTNTPPEVVIRWRAPQPLLPQDAGLGIKLAASPGRPDGSVAAHPLVAIGDSLTHGFQSLAITNTDKSWPALLAQCLGVQLSYPVYPGPTDYPGIPLNLEAIVRALETDDTGAAMTPHLWHTATTLLGALKDISAYWVHEAGADPLPALTQFHDNLAIYGWDLRDALSKDLTFCTNGITASAQHHLTLKSVAGSLLPHMLPAAYQRAAVRALQSPTPHAGRPSVPGTVTQVSAAQWLGQDGGIGTLVVALGANNALGTVIDLKVNWSQDATYQSLEHKGEANIWQPRHFLTELNLLRDEIKKVDADRVVWATVPHVTVAPLAHGVGQRPAQSRYFPWYSRPWIPDADFRPGVNAHLTGDEARVIDATIDMYNYAIKAMVRDARSDPNDPRDWLLFDMCGLLDRLAYRRYLAGGAPHAWKDYVLDPALRALNPPPDTRFFFSGEHGRIQGGLIALDGVHPTTVGYAILAQEMMTTLHRDGVVFPNAVAGRGGPRIDFRAIIGRDTLVSDPPRHLDLDRPVLNRIYQDLDLGMAFLGRPPL